MNAEKNQLTKQRMIALRAGPQIVARFDGPLLGRPLTMHLKEANT